MFLAYGRFPPLRPTNHAPQRHQPTHPSASVALTQLGGAQTSIALGARGATACHFPRVPSLKAFGRRPRCKPHRCDRPASETLNKSGPSLRIIIYVRNIFGLPTKEASHPSMMEMSRATTSAVPPTADIVGHRGHVRKVPRAEVRSYSITLSARRSSEGGTVRPSAVAVLRLSASSTLVGCSTGM